MRRTSTPSKQNLAQWLDGNPSNTRATGIALLETTLDRYLAERTSEASDLATAAADATDMVQAVLRRAVRRRRLALHLKASRRSRASVIQITDQELANRLTEILNLLDLVAEPLPQDAALRQFIDGAADPLGSGPRRSLIPARSRTFTAAPRAFRIRGVVMVNRDQPQ